MPPEYLKTFHVYAAIATASKVADNRQTDTHNQSVGFAGTDLPWESSSGLYNKFQAISLLGETFGAACGAACCWGTAEPLPEPADTLRLCHGLPLLSPSGSKSESPHAATWSTASSSRFGGHRLQPQSHMATFAHLICHLLSDLQAVHATLQLPAMTAVSY